MPPNDKLDDLQKIVNLATDLTLAATSIGYPAVALFVKLAANHAEGREITVEDLQDGRVRAQQAIDSIPGTG